MVSKQKEKESRMTALLKLDRNLKLGSEGKDVEAIIKGMVEAGVLKNQNDKITNTEDVAIKVIQANYGLSIDGIFGKNSLKSLQTALDSGTKILDTPLDDVMNPVHTGDAKDQMMYDGLKRAIHYLSLGACEIGGNNKGKWVAHFHGVSEERLLKGNWPWCAAFVNCCYSEASKENGIDKGFDGSGLALNIRNQVKSRNESGIKLLKVDKYRPGMLAFWVRGNAGWQGHIEMVHSVLSNKFVLFLGGNRTAKVDFFVQKIDRLSFGDCNFSTVSYVTPRK